MVDMPWRFTNEVETYSDQVWGLLSVRPMEQTVPLTVIEHVRAGRRWSDDEMLFGWYEDQGRVCGAVSMTPPFPMLLAAVPDDTVAELVAALHGRRAIVPGVNGDDATVERFSKAWTADTGQDATTGMRLRLYVLDTLRRPAPEPPGRVRPAGQRDLDLVVDWMRAFQWEAEAQTADVEPMARGQVNDGRLWLWEDEASSAVAMAGRQAIAAGVSRVGPVYTPPANRRHGYGAAVTAACTEDALRRGAEHVVLFTDLANPTSNSIYQQIGYRPVSDRTVVHFD